MLALVLVLVLVLILTLVLMPMLLLLPMTGSSLHTPSWHAAMHGTDVRFNPRACLAEGFWL